MLPSFWSFVAASTQLSIVPLQSQSSSYKNIIMANHSILVKNKSGTPRAYFLIPEAPRVSGGGSPRVYQNVYIASPPTSSGNGIARFSIPKNFFAVTGTTPGQALGSNITVSTSDYRITKLSLGDSSPGSKFVMTAGPAGNGAMFDNKLTENTTKEAGAFAISCDDSFKLNNGGRYKPSVS